MFPTNAKPGRTRLANLSRDPVIVLNLAGKETHAARCRGFSGVSAYWDVGACFRSTAGGRRRTRFRPRQAAPAKTPQAPAETPEASAQAPQNTNPAATEAMTRPA